MSGGEGLIIAGKDDLHSAVSFGANITLIKQLVEQADANTVNDTDGDGCNALMLSAWYVSLCSFCTNVVVHVTGLDIRS